MRWAPLFIFLLAAVAAAAPKEDEANDITHLKPPINLDANLRRALLKALTELENEENEKARFNESHQTPLNLPHFDTSDKIVEKASASALSFFATSDLSTTTEKLTTLLTTTPKVSENQDQDESSEKSIIIIQRSKGLQHKPITAIHNYNLDPVNEAEQFLTSASSSFTTNKFSGFSKSDSQEVRSVNNGANSNSLDINERRTSATKILRPKIETTTASTTTTSTEESEAKVEDVQFFSAPLVAAFTVHQDERGLPKSVEPIYRPTTTTTKLEVKPTKSTKVKETVKQANHDDNNNNNNDQLRTQFILQEKQRALEEEILRLKQQQQQQNYLIRQQQLLHEQQLQLQKQKLLEEELRIRNLQQQRQQSQPLNFDEEVRIRNNQQPFVPIIKSTTNQFRSNDNARIKGSLLSFQPSLTFTPSADQLSTTLPLNAQQLPIKNAAEFRPIIRTPVSYQPFNFAQQTPNNNNNNNNPTFSISQSIQPPALNHHRVFRHESNVGNFFNTFNQPIQQQQNRFFRSNAEATFTSPSPYNTFSRLQPPAVNQQLNHLLYNSGIIRGKQQEDLNIVSKVLSLNHYGRDNNYASSDLKGQRLAV